MQGVSYDLKLNLKVINPYSFMNLLPITNPDECGKRCDASENCFGGWFNGETLECWNMFEKFAKHQNKYFYQVD